MIPHSTITQIKDATRIQEVISDFLQLKPRGTNLLGLCPFHNEKTGSFTVNISRQIFKCFGCGKAGDAISFLQEHEKLTYPEALLYLAKKYNITVEEEAPSPEELEMRSIRESLFAINTFAATWYHQQLNQHSHAIDYLTVKRGWTPETIKNWSIGYATPLWDGFTKHALQQQYALPLLLQSGLTKQRDATDADAEKQYDFIRNRITIPIHGSTGRIVSFGARQIEDDKKYPKYINGPETDIYNKSLNLFGLFHAKRTIVELGEAILTEGYADVITLHQAGITNAVASCGTSLTPDQCRLLHRFTDTVNILFDNDPAGIKAALRGNNTLLEQGFNVYITLLPNGHDPDSFARTLTPVKLQEFIKSNRQNFITFMLAQFAQEALADPIQKTKIIHAALTTLSIIPDPILRQQYLQQAATMLSAPEPLLGAQLSQILAKNAQPKQNTYTPPASTQPEILPPSQQAHAEELGILRLLINHGDSILIAPNNENMTVRIAIMHDLQIDNITFNSPLLQIIYNYYINLTLTCHQVTNNLTHIPQEDVRNTVINLLNFNPETQPPADELRNQTITAINYLKLHRALALKKKNAAILQTIPHHDLSEKTLSILQQQKQIQYFITQVSQSLGIAVIK